MQKIKTALLFFVLVLTACTQSIHQATPQNSMGLVALPGRATVDGGASGYTIPIELPDIDNAFRPKLSVYYSNRSGNGMLGMGWSLSAGGSVHRCPFIPDGDGLSREVLYAPDDRLCINGTKMALYRGDYGKSGSIYVPEANATSGVKLYGDLNSPDSGFASFDSTGDTELFQTPLIAQGVSAPLSWLLTLLIRKDGQTIEYHYNQFGPGEVLLTEIRYGGKYSAGDKTFVHGNKYVRFVYAPSNHVTSSFLSGGEQRSTQRLDRVSVGIVSTAGETLLGEYVFEYRTSQATGRWLLSSVQRCKDYVARVQCTLPTKFQWQDAEVAFSSYQLVDVVPMGERLAPDWLLGSPVPAFTTFFSGGDYNADGRRDPFVRSANGRVAAYVLQPGGKVVKQVDVSQMMTVNASFVPTNGRALRELGSAEIFGDVEGRLAALDWEGDTFATPAVTSIPYTSDTVLLDATGDGLTDVVTGSHAQNRYVVTLYRNEGSSDKTLSLSRGEIVARFEDKAGLRLESRAALEGLGRTALVMDGERVAHGVRFATENDGTLKVSTFSLRDIGVSSEAIANGFLFADVNGDGYDDIVYTFRGTWHVQMNRGFQYGDPIDTGAKDVRSSVGRAGTLVFDVDSDGRSDLVFPARRITEFCVAQPGRPPLCSDALGSVEPRMDLGIYEYNSLSFDLDASGKYVPHLREDMHLIGQANRAQPADIFGDGYTNLLSPFDRGISNGWFKAEDGKLSECPPNFKCGLHVAQRAHIQRDDRSDAPLEFLVGAESAPAHNAHWIYYPLSNPFRHVYDVPPLGSADRFIDMRHFYFTSSMFVVGEFSLQEGVASDILRYEYGAAQYSTAGRGFDGFKWIVVHDTATKKKYGSWFGQDGPYRGTLERSWTEAESDDENDYFHGSPGKRYLEFKKIELGCTGPKNNEVTTRFHCDPSDFPSFNAYQKR